MELSIIVPAYNMEAYLPSCLTSLLRIVDSSNPQPPVSNLQPLDVIVVNDGSTDGTSAVAHDFERRYPGLVRVIDKANGHYGSCVNAALPLVRGEYVKLLDADDTVDPANFAAFLTWLRELPERPDMIISDYVKVAPSGRILESCTFPLPTDHCFTPDEAMEKGDVFVQLHAVTHRTENLRQMGYQQLEGVPYTDFQWALTPIAHVEKIAYFPKPVVRYLVGRKGQTVDPVLVARDADTQAQVSLAIYREYRAALAHGLPHGAKYYGYHVLRNYAWMVQLYALGIEGHYPASTGESFDREVQSLIPAIHAAADSYALRLRILPFTPSPSSSFYYIRAWRKSYSRKGWKFGLFRLRRLLRFRART